jgi:cell division protein FtsQ
MANVKTSAVDNPVPFFHRRIVVIAVALLAMLIAATVAWGLAKWLPEVPIREVVFKSSNEAGFTYVKQADLSRVAAAIATPRHSLLRTNLEEVKAAVSQVEWVRVVDVRRRLPATLEVTVEEHVPFAIWQDIERDEGGLVNTKGEAFRARANEKNQAELPLFAGPTGASKEVFVGFEQFRKILASIERLPFEVRLSSRRAWTLKLDNGAVVELGRSDAEPRLARFTRTYVQVAALQAANTHVDLRYPNGLALRASTANASPSAAERVKKL